MDEPLSTELRTKYATAAQLYPGVTYTREEAWTCPQHNVAMFTETVTTPIGVFDTVTCPDIGCDHDRDRR